MSTIAATTHTTANGTTDAIFSTGNTSAGRIVVQSAGGLFLASNATTNAINITTGANVGIGTGAPPAKLTANGTIRSTSTGASGFIDIRHDGTNAVLVGNTGSLLAYAEGLNSIIFHTNNTQRFSIGSDGSFTSVIPSGSTLLPTFMCRAWVNFNGTGTVAIRGNGNVTSITDNGVGDYTVNFTTAMPDANYAVSGTVRFGTAGGGQAYGVNIKQAAGAIATGSVNINSINTSTGSLTDMDTVCVQIFR